MVPAQPLSVVKLMIVHGSAVPVTVASPSVTGDIIGGGVGAVVSTVTIVGGPGSPVPGSLHITLNSSQSPGSGLTGEHENDHVPLAVVVHTSALEFVTLNTWTTALFTLHTHSTGSPSVGSTTGGSGVVPGSITVVLDGSDVFHHTVAVPSTTSHGFNPGDGFVHVQLPAASATIGFSSHVNVTHELLSIIVAHGSLVHVTGFPSVTFIVGGATSVVPFITVVVDSHDSLPASSVAVAQIKSPSTNAGLHTVHDQLPAASVTTSAFVQLSVVPAQPLSVVKLMIVHGSAVPVTVALPSVTGDIIGGGVG